MGFCEHDSICHIAVDCGDSWTIAEEPVGCWGRPSETYSNPAILRLPLALSAPQEAIATTWLRQQVGTGYGFGQIAADALELHGLPARDEHDGKYVCSSLIAEALYLAGAYPFGNIPPEEIRPDHFHALYLGKQLSQGASINALASFWNGLGQKTQLAVETVAGTSLAAGADALYQQLGGGQINLHAVAVVAGGAALTALVRVARGYLENAAPAPAPAVALPATPAPAVIPPVPVVPPSPVIPPSA